jgi:hypothetical protein
MNEIEDGNNFYQNDMAAEQGNISVLIRDSFINLDVCCSLPRRNLANCKKSGARSAEAQALIRRSHF